jgi:hypothetical protein
LGLTSFIASSQIVVPCEVVALIGFAEVVVLIGSAEVVVLIGSAEVAEAPLGRIETTRR